MRIPTSKGGGARFRGPTSSNAYNTNEDDKYLELLELYKQSNENVQKLTEANQIILAENVSLHNYVAMLEQRLNAISKKMTDIEEASPYDPMLFKTGYVDVMTDTYPSISQENSDTSLRCDIDLQNRCVTAPLIHKIPKTHSVDEKTGAITVPSSLEIKVGRTNTAGSVIDNNIYNAFNGDNESYWQRTVSYNFAECPAEEDVVIEISLPNHLVNNLNINEIYIHPHPERGIQIKNVEIQYQDAWTQIDGFLQNDLSSISSYEYSPRKRWSFNSKPVQKLRITLVQRNPIDLNGKKVFMLGAQEIGVYLSMFEPGGGIILTPFEMEGLYNIESVDHVFLNRNAFGIDLDVDLEGRVVEYEVLTELVDGTLTSIRNTEWAAQSSRKLWIKSKLLPYNGVAPCLHAVKINYSR